MRKEIFVYHGLDARISEVLALSFLKINYKTFNKCLRLKDIRINNIKIVSDIIVKDGDEITIFLSDSKNKYKIIFEDDNIFIVHKPTKISTTGLNSLEEYLQNSFYNECKACHRLDTNTEGLVIFAKNEIVFDEMKKLFTNNQIEKHYYTIVKGDVKKSYIFKVYLIKNELDNKVKVFNNQVKNSVEIITIVNPIKKLTETTLLDVELITGKTHQIRAHLSYRGYPVVGDTKYGDYKFNKEKKAESQLLVGYKIVFHVNSGFFSYLNGKEVLLNAQDIYINEIKKELI